MMDIHSGGCLCGGVRYLVSGPLSDVIACHCEQCRRTSGHHVAATAAALTDFRLISHKTLRWYNASPAARRGFCEVCGANLFWAPEGGETVSIYAGTLDRTEGLRLAAHIYTAHKGDYYDIADDVPQYAGRH